MRGCMTYSRRTAPLRWSRQPRTHARRIPRCATWRPSRTGGSGPRVSHLRKHQRGTGGRHARVYDIQPAYASVMVVSDGGAEAYAPDPDLCAPCPEPYSEVCEPYGRLWFSARALALNASNVLPVEGAFAAKTIPAGQCAGGPGWRQYAQMGLSSLTVMVYVGKPDVVPGLTGMLLNP